ncbi:MAG: immunoglobulin-like domain-containing protein [bacterium]
MLDILNTIGAAIITAFSSIALLFSASTAPAAVVVSQQGTTASSVSSSTLAVTTDSGTASTTVFNTYITQPVIERIVERAGETAATSGDSSTFVTQQEFTQKLNTLSATLGRSLYGNSYPAPSTNYGGGGVQNMISLSNKIDQLTNTVITTPTITGATINGGTISATTAAFSGDATLSSTTASSLTVTGLSSFAGLTTLGYASTTQIGSTGSAYFATSGGSVGIGTTSPSDLLAVNGAVYLAATTPAVTSNRLYNSSGDLYWGGNLVSGAAVGTWTSTSGNVYRPTGNVGIGTTSPWRALSVNGSSDLGNNALAGSFTSTTTTATSTFAGGFSAASSTFNILNHNGYVGIGTTTPKRMLHLSSVTSATDQMIRAESSVSTNGATILTMNDVGDIFQFVMNGSNIGNGFVSTTNNAARLQSTGAGGMILNTTNASAPIVFGTGGVALANERMRLTSTGNLGIGTSTPGQKLSVAGDILGNNIIGSYFTATSTIASSTLSTGGLAIGTSQFVVQQNSGRVGIGIANPTEKLHVTGLRTNNSARILVTDENGAIARLNADGYNNGTDAAANLFLSGDGNQGIKMVSGGVSSYITAGSTGVSITGAGTGYGLTLAGPTNTLGGTLSTDSSGSSVWVPLTITANDSQATNVLSVGKSSSAGSYLLMNSSGNLGIGTTTPGQKLSVAGDILGNNIIGSYFTATSSTATSTFLGGATFATGGGNVGIGTATTDALLSVVSPNNAVDTILSVRTNNLSQGVGIGYSSIRAIGSSANVDLTIAAKGSGTAYLGDSGNGFFVSPSVAGASISTNGITRFSLIDGVAAFATDGFSITANSATAATIMGGNVGIGTASPADKLQVTGGNILLDAGGSIQFGSTGLNSVGIKGYWAGSGSYMHVYSVGDIRNYLDANNNSINNFEIYGNVAEGTTEGALFTVQDTGNVGIGTTTPYAKLSLSANHTGTHNPTLFAIASSTGGTSTTTAFTVLANGNVGIGTSSPADKLDVAGFIKTAKIPFATNTALTAVTTRAMSSVEYKGKLYVGTSDGNVYVYDGSTWTFSYNNGSGPVIGLVVYNGNLYAAFQNVGVISFNGSTWGSALGSLPTYIYQMAVYNSKLYVSIYDGGASQVKMYTFDDTSWVELTNIPYYHSADQYGIRTLAVYNGKLYGGNGLGEVYAFDGSSWALLTDLGAFSITTFGTYKGKLFASGGGNVYSFDGSTWSSSLYSTGYQINSFVEYAGKLYIGAANGNPAIYMVSYDGNSFTAETSVNASFTDYITSGTVYNGKLYMTGSSALMYSERLESQLAKAYDPTLVPFNEQYQNFTKNLTVTGNVGIGTTSPAARLSVTQSANTNAGGLWLAGTDGDYRAIYMSDTSGTLSFNGGDNAGTLNTASLNSAGAWINASDRSYKENIVDFSTKYTLDDIMKLEPRFYTMKGTGKPQIGFIAQEVKLVIPEVVEGVDGSMGVSYGNMVAIAIQGIKELNTTLREVGTKIAGFADKIMSREIVVSERICINTTCVTEDQLKLLLKNAAALASTPASTPTQSSSGDTATTTLDTTAPVITLNGNNPAQIEKNASYLDLGATVTDNVSLNLGYLTTGDQIDTTVPGTYTVTYTATDVAGNTATASRTVIVSDPAAPAPVDPAPTESAPAPVDPAPTPIEVAP